MKEKKTELLTVLCKWRDPVHFLKSANCRNRVPESHFVFSVVVVVVFAIVSRAVLYGKHCRFRAKKKKKNPFLWFYDPFVPRLNNSRDDDNGHNPDNDDSKSLIRRPQQTGSILRSRDEWRNCGATFVSRVDRYGSLPGLGSNRKAYRWWDRAPPRYEPEDPQHEHRASPFVDDGVVATLVSFEVDFENFGAVGFAGRWLALEYPISSPGSLWLWYVWAPRPRYSNEATRCTF